MALTRTNGKVPTGYADEVVISDASFRAAHRRVQLEQARRSRDGEPPRKRKREERGDAGIVYGAGSYKGPWAKFEEHRPDVSDEDEDGSDVSEYDVEYEEDAIPAQPSAPSTKAGTAYGDTGDGAETSTFHGDLEHDYQGRTYMHVPQDLEVDLRRELPPVSERKNYHPKKLVHTWRGHTKPVTQTRFFPDSGHLLLSAGADGKVLLWDVYHARELLRSFAGHAKSVADIDFAPDGRRFLSASYDRKIKQWDTETGACVARFSTGATPHVVRVTPTGGAHEFIAGMGDKKIVQFDTRTASGAKPVQEYDHHLGPVNTLTFCDEGRRFMSTSDDKSLRAWEYGIPVPIKYIAEPYMYPLVRASMHPTGKAVAYQSADNKIVVYGAGDKFRQNRKKEFRGHNNAGYAIDVAISPDGGIVASGDSGGYVCFWDYKTCKMWHKIQAAEGAVVSVAWHPRETSKVVTGALDGTLKYWD